MEISLVGAGEVLIGVASLWTAVNATLAMRAAQRASEHSQATGVVVRDMGATIYTLEQNTNSIKDALVAATAKASDLEGEKRGIEIGKGTIDA